MRSLLLLSVLALGPIGCSGSSPSTPTPTATATTCQDRSARNFGSALPCTYPPPILATTIDLASNNGVYGCFTGLCTDLTWTIENFGPGCATNTQVTFRAYGSDGNGPQLGVDIPMGLQGGSLSGFFFRPGTTLTIHNLAPFNDVRSAHTKFKPFIAWTNVAC